MAPAHPDNCRCCAGVNAETPVPIDNPPGQSEIAYRAGVHSRFKESLLARLSDPELPALAGLTTREDEDLTVALCDALATTLDVLAFYQERIANENFIRTATERRSILELARLIGYELAPGVAASTHLAFTLQEVPGSPALAAGPVEIPTGSRVQSVPGPGEKPQTFETVEPVQARAGWNAIPVQTSVPWRPKMGDTRLWLEGTGNSVQPGDAILVVGQARIDYHGSEEWDVRVVTEVREDRLNQRRLVRWDEPLGSFQPKVTPAGAGAALYVFRQRAALFGHNAPDPRMLSTNDNKLSDLTNGYTWNNFSIGAGNFDLDADYPKVVPGSWVALKKPVDPAIAGSVRGYVELYRASKVEYLTRTGFGISSKITRVHPDTTENLSTYGLRGTTVMCQSEEVAATAIPIDYPMYGTTIALGRLAPGIDPGRALAIAGKLARVRFKRGFKAPKLEFEGGEAAVEEGDSLRLAAVPEKKTGSTFQVLNPEELGAILAQPELTQLRLMLIDRDGRSGTMVVKASAIELVPALEEDEEVSEIAYIGNLPSSVSADRDRTTFTLSRSLKHCYDRGSTRVSGNVARATHGESTSNEILGSGDARVPNATFTLHRAPLTFVKAATPTGRRSSLELRANDLLWEEVESLYHRGPSERVYEVTIDDQARATVKFGDGTEGGRLPSGDHNVRASYRHGLGLEGNVPAHKVTNLLSRPLGVTGATNPEPAEGGEDPEVESRARVNAPLTVRTLDRAVSVRDYQDFALSFSGIAKAHALWVPSGPARGIFVTVAGEKGVPVEPGSDTHIFLQAALRRYGDPLIPLYLESFSDVRFRLRLAVKVAAEADPTLVLPAIEERLRTAFGFESRSFGQGVSIDEVTALAQGVPGVEAVNVTELRRSDKSAPKPLPRIFALLPVASLTSAPLPAELLTLESGPLNLEVMP